MTQPRLLDRLAHAVTVVRHAAATGMADFRAMFTWRSWVFGYLSRILAQVTFFAFIGRLLDSPETVRYLLIGSAVAVAIMEPLLVVTSTTWERRTGTLPLLIASATSPVLVFCARSLPWIGSGTLSATVALFVLSPLFGVSLPMPSGLLAVPLIGAVAVSTYCLGLFLAGLVLRAMQLRNLVVNVAWMLIAILAGVYVPLETWPTAVQLIGTVLPGQHGLGTVRALLDGGGTGEVLLGVGFELLVGLGWLLVASLTFHRLAEHGRRDGSIEFAA